MTDLVLRRATDLWAWFRGADAVWLIVAAVPLMLFALDPDGTPAVLETAARAFAGTVPYMAIAIALIAYLKASGAEGVVSRAFHGSAARMIVLAAMLGGLAPFCSCEVIPFIAALLAAGTPLSAVMAFWLASPLMDPGQFAYTSAVIGFDFAVGKTIAAVGIGLAGGFAMHALTRTGAFVNPLKEQKKSCCGCGVNPMSGQPVWRFWQEEPRRDAFRQTALEQALFLGKWLSLAYLLEGMLIQYVPAENVVALVGGEGLWPIVVGAFVGAPAYLNGFAAVPLIDGLMEQGMTAGAAMSFMVAGAVSSIPAMAAVFALVRRPVFVTYLAFGIGGAILSGILFQAAVAIL